MTESGDPMGTFHAKLKENTEVDDREKVGKEGGGGRRDCDGREIWKTPRRAEPVGELDLTDR